MLKLSVVASLESEERVSDFLEKLTGQTPVVFRKEGAGILEVSCYCARDFPVTEAARLFRRTIKAWHKAGVAVGTARFSVKVIRKEDWAESWKKHFPPLEVGSALLLKPSWNRQKTKPGQVEVILDPGLSFGTGHHPTTEFCLRQIVKHRGRNAPRSLLDMGTGSGILAIAAVKLGYRPVDAFDYDPESIRVAKENAAINGVADRIKIARKDLTRLPQTSRRPYDVVCANLEYDLLLSQKEKILARLKPGGVLVLAGILKRQFPAVTIAYEKAGMEVIATKGRGEWQSGAFANGSD